MTSPFYWTGLWKSVELQKSWQWTIHRFSISMQQVFCLPHSWQITRQRNSKNCPGIYMKTSICQPRLERGNRFWQSGMQSANWVPAVRGRFYSSPRTDLWVSISSAGSSHMHNHRYQRCPGTSSYKDLSWCMHPMTDSQEYTLKIAKLFCRNWRWCRMTWFSQFLMKDMKYSERTKGYSRKFVPSTSWFSQTFPSPSYWTTIILRCAGWTSRRLSVAQNELPLEQTHFSCKMVSQLHVLAQLALHWSHLFSRCPKGMMVICLRTLPKTQWKLCGSFCKGTPACGLIGTLHCLCQTNIFTWFSSHILRSAWRQFSRQLTTYSWFPLRNLYVSYQRL